MAQAKDDFDCKDTGDDARRDDFANFAAGQKCVADLALTFHC